MGLRDLVAGRGVAKAPAAVRVIEGRDDAIETFYELTPSPSAPEVMQMARTGPDYGSAVARGLAAAERWAAERGVDAELRMLNIPALHTEALLVRPEGAEDEGEIAIVVRTLQPDVAMLEPMPLSELLDRLKAPARLILEHEDDLKGS